MVLSSWTAGKIYLDKKEVVDNTSAEFRTKIAMIFQDYNLVENISVINNVLTGSLTRVNKLSSLLYMFPAKNENGSNRMPG